jgi:hypothetical protein
MIEMPEGAAGWQRWLVHEVMPFWAGKLVAAFAEAMRLWPALADSHV